MYKDIRDLLVCVSLHFVKAFVRDFAQRHIEEGHNSVIFFCSCVCSLSKTVSVLQKNFVEVFVHTKKRRILQDALSTNKVF